MLSILEQNPGTSWEVLLSNTSIKKSEDNAETCENPEDNIPKKTIVSKSADELVSFKL
jgi:hypothetical protein